MFKTQLCSLGMCPTTKLQPQQGLSCCLMYTQEKLLRRLPTSFLTVASQLRSASAVETSEADHRFYSGDCFLLFQVLR